jgi:hypothetical protein
MLFVVYLKKKKMFWNIYFEDNVIDKNKSDCVFCFCWQIVEIKRDLDKQP